ncbi:GntR family transcriptional regulator [Mumia zhuanghuii]|uniref:GntR family transcriptional regulator n=2 Tax=Mumia TaxID=1546255 RepID=A0ABW1QI69_9ACTN|nr:MULTISPECIES: GntR family transcriptional regulator [Mumia]KAA1424641.1 GntR family transcriptional regulator [Mumia zhuanghuii]
MVTEPFRPLRDDVRAAIRERIVRGDYAPGTRLVERAIAGDLGVSRVPVREALHSLVREGFAVDRATRGIEVRQYDAAQIAELTEVAGALEVVLVRQIASAERPTDLEPIRAVLGEASEALDDGDHDAAVAANARFHEALVEVGHGGIVGEILDGLTERRRWLLRQHTDPAIVHREHVDLYDALAAADSERAVAIIEAHARDSVVRAVSAMEHVAEVGS